MIIAICAAAFGAIVQTQTHHRSTAEALSFWSAYAALGLLALALAIGPWNLLRRQPNPVSTDLRRDIGIWAAIYGVAHTVFGLNVHMRGHMLRYFINDAPQLDVNTKAFLGANWLGLVASLFLLVLMAISNDFALRTLGTRKWKTVQQSTYVLLALVMLHGAIYQILEKRRWLLATIFSLLIAGALALQSAGIRAWRAKKNRKPR